MKLYFKKYGQGIPLLILHGLFGSGNNWRSFAASLGEHFEVYLIDLRNHGKSPHSNGFTYDLMCNDIEEFLIDNGLEKVIILGHSLGGKAAITFALKNPHNVLKLIVVDIGIKQYPVKDKEMLEAMGKMNFGKILSRQDADKYLAKSITDFNVRQFLLQNLHWSKDKKLAWKMNLEVIVKRIDEVGRSQQAEMPFLKPCLFVSGIESDYILKDDLDEINEVFPNCKLETISGSGHWVHFDNPEEFSVVIRNFLLPSKHCCK